MYLPPFFEESRTHVLHEFIHQQPLGTLVTLGSKGLSANHIPFVIDPEPAPHGTLRGHVSRANAVWRDFDANTDALVVFQGPQGYIGPSWYPTKQETGKVVPTWNYAVVHAYGPLHVIDDPAWLLAFVRRLTAEHEARQRKPWSVDDAPTEYIQQQLRGIVGIEIPVRRLLGKWKASQNRNIADREGAAAGLMGSGELGAITLAEVMRLRGSDSRS